MENVAQKIEKTALDCTDNGLHCRLHRRKELIVSSTDFPDNRQKSLTFLQWCQRGPKIFSEAAAQNAPEGSSGEIPNFRITLPLSTPVTVTLSAPSV